LEEENNHEHEHSCQQVDDIGQLWAVEGLLERANFVRPGDKQVEQGDNCTFKLGTTAGVDRGWAERFPDDVLADVGGDEQ